MRRSASADEHRVLSNGAIVAWAVGLLVLAAGSIVTLWSLLGSGGPNASVRLDIIRTAFSIVVGGGGAAGLLLAARRQRATELDLRQRDHDAAETRVTELYGKAADQMGSDKALCGSPGSSRWRDWPRAIRSTGRPSWTSSAPTCACRGRTM
ncbi:hypothetical protein ACFQ0O_07495 [Saccharopolyspora spinosporotrichia]